MNKPNLDQAIKESIGLIESRKSDSYPKFHQFDKMYLYTTESIRGYLEQETYNKSRALSVIASGDHIFDLVCDGVLNVDSFDINALSYYIFWLKASCIMSLSYEEYLEAASRNFYTGEFEEFFKLLNKIKSNLPKDVYDYFAFIMTFLEEYERKYFSEKNDAITYLYRDPNRNSVFIKKLIRDGWDLRMEALLFLKSEEEYIKLQKRLEKASIEFYFADARNLPDELRQEYDIILLSNIADYIHREDQLLTVEEFKDFVNRFYNLLNEDGVLINYFFNIVRGDRVPLVPKSLVTLNSLGKDNVVFLNNGESYYRVRKKS